MDLRQRMINYLMSWGVSQAREEEIANTHCSVASTALLRALSTGLLRVDLKIKGNGR